MSNYEEASFQLATIDSLRLELARCKDKLELAQIDRRRALIKVEELRQELGIVHRQLDTFQGRQMHELAARRSVALQYYKDEFARTHPGYRQLRVVGRGGLLEGGEEENGDGCDEVDCDGPTNH